MKAAVTQPNYLPWLGYFELLDKVEEWISLNNTQVVKRSFNVRNRVAKYNDDPSWLSMKIEKASQKTKFNEAKIDFSFVSSHLNKLSDYYRDSTFFNSTFDFFSEVLRPKFDEYTVSEYNTRVIKSICEFIGIEIRISFASDVEINNPVNANDRILKLCIQKGITEYYNFKAGIDAGLYDIEQFTENEIVVFQQDYKHPKYSQSQKEFIPYLSIADLLFNEGNENALSIIRSGSKWKKLN